MVPEDDPPERVEIEKMNTSQEYLKAKLALTAGDNHYFAAIAFVGFALGLLTFLVMSA
jgi:hypothetical protein